ncbi:hypothetical protein MUDAN_BIHEEGNE_00674 [Lactiplantibacillus mudanjiangensis]|uniref:hypothetical protein n=1 Tax=Lactiplantibacillus mudanjiangensis TaxID=1296538 RepID=UPI001014EFDA|nr:hypothetical protein MUDAN_BIHEEGNE_00674 [Lactiplantibacillus mudanjiangensis]
MIKLSVPNEKEFFHEFDKATQNDRLIIGDIQYQVKHSADYKRYHLIELKPAEERWIPIYKKPDKVASVVNEVAGLRIDKAKDILETALKLMDYVSVDKTSSKVVEQVINNEKL